MTHKEKIKHLYSRAGFGLHPKELEKLSQKSIPQLVNRLVANPIGDLENLIDLGQSLGGGKRSDMTDAEKKAFRKMNAQGLKAIRKKWIEDMAFGPYPFVQKMSLFWHGHFACHTIFSGLAQRYIKAIQKNALGDFKTLVMAMSKSVAMIHYLNNQQNKKNSPNENFARELLELFTIGRGHYTEKDIKEAARAFTGWSSNLSGEFVFRPFIHDYGQKSFMGEKGKFGGEDIIKIILSKKECAQFICAKIYAFFVNQKIDHDLVNQLAIDFKASNYNIKKLMKQIFLSDWFYEEKNVGNQIKSPIQYIATLMKQLKIRFHDVQSLDYLQKSLGQVLVYPPNVAGWPGGRKWIDNSTLMLRLNLPYYLMKNIDLNLKVKNEAEADTARQNFKKLNASMNLNPLEKLLAKEDQAKWASILSSYLIMKEVNIDEKLIDANTSDPKLYFQWILTQILSLPEYQLA